MELRILSPQDTFEFAIAWLEIQTVTGNYVIQAGHAPMILSLAPEKPITFRLKNGKQQSMVIRNGIAEITRRLITILINEIV